MKSSTPEKTEAVARTIAGQIIAASGAAVGGAGPPGENLIKPIENKVDREIVEIEKLLGD